jgi:dihydroorotase
MSAEAAPDNGFAPSGVTPLDCAASPPATVLVRGARLLDPRASLDGQADVLIRGGAIAEIGSELAAPDGAEVVDG